MAGKFNLAELMSEGKVSKLDTGNAGREQIEYIDIDLIDDDPNNFYELSSLDELAANIELFGLQQPLRVRTNSEDPARVIIVSGHRRRAAVRQLVEGGRADLREIPCIRERTEGSAALQELRLIYANSDTRHLTSAEISKQAERVEALLYQLKEEGYEFPGRMRDHVAEACKVSKTKLARLKVIRDNLDDAWRRSYEKGELAESTAYTLAQMPAEHQQCIFRGIERKNTQIRWFYESEARRCGEKLASVDKLICKRGARKDFPCSNIEAKREQVVYQSNHYGDTPCSKCCDKCVDLAKCKNACPMLAEKIKKLRNNANAQRRQEKAAQEEKDRPVIDAIKKYWDRFGVARSMADKTMKECYKAMGVHYGPFSENAAMALERLEAKYSTSTKLPYGYNCHLSDVQYFVGVADLFGVSLDYLLCRTDNPKGIEVAPPKKEKAPCALCKSAHPSCDKCCSTCDDYCNALQACRYTDLPDAPMQAGPAWHPTSVEPSIGQDIIVVDATGYAEDARYVSSGEISGGGMNWDQVTLWTPWPNGATEALAEAVPPAAGWVPLQFVNGMDKPPKDGKYYCRFDCEGTTIEQIACWDSNRGVWAFKSGETDIDAKCLGWFPLPAEVEKGASDADA